MLVTRSLRGMGGGSTVKAEKLWIGGMSGEGIKDVKTAETGFVREVRLQ